ncbi:hypothetical protein OF83DRAFT_1089056 [Amylostereum chailletii]|nr:hypothetical protein OF83DRAFT_1089056 [Amylostereum chailletii]
MPSFPSTQSGSGQATPSRWSSGEAIERLAKTSQDDMERAELLQSLINVFDWRIRRAAAHLTQPEAFINNAGDLISSWEWDGLRGVKTSIQFELWTWIRENQEYDVRAAFTQVINMALGEDIGNNGGKAWKAWMKEQGERLAVVATYAGGLEENMVHERSRIVDGLARWKRFEKNCVYSNRNHGIVWAASETGLWQLASGPSHLAIED